MERSGKKDESRIIRIIMKSNHFIVDAFISWFLSLARSVENQGKERKQQKKRNLFKLNELT